ncbi:MAG: dihydropteroate synthase-like protein [Acidilobus sp.]
MKFGIITSGPAEPVVREVLQEGGLKDFVVVALPVPAISLLTTSAIASVLSSRRDLLSGLSDVDIVVLPGTVRGDASEVAKVTGKPAFKGPRSLGELPVTLKYVSQGARLDTVKAADEVLGSLTPSISYEEAFRIGQVPVPRRGPPVLLLSEVDPRAQDFAATARRYVEEGAQVIMVGAEDGMSLGELRRRVREAKGLGLPVIAEAPSRAYAEEAIAAGADGLSVADYQVPEVEDLLSRDLALLVGGDSLDRLRDVERELAGRAKLIVDPSLAVPPLGLSQSVERYLRASRELSSPLLFSAANVTEEVEADTAGVHAVLALMAVEVRASAYLVVEETYKSVHGTSEAREAIRLAESAYAARASERGMFSRLLVLKQDYPPPPQPQEEVSAEHVGYVEPQVSAGEYVRISADPARGVMRVTLYRDGRAVGSLEGSHALSLARALVRRFNVSAEHAAYIGYELSKAELSLKLGRTYVQDEPVIVTPWEKNGNSHC